MALNWVMLQTLEGTKIQMNLGTYKRKMHHFREQQQWYDNIVTHGKNVQRNTDWVVIGWKSLKRLQVTQ